MSNSNPMSYSEIILKGAVKKMVGHNTQHGNSVIIIARGLWPSLCFGIKEGIQVCLVFVYITTSRNLSTLKLVLATRLLLVKWYDNKMVKSPMWPSIGLPSCNKEKKIFHILALACNSSFIRIPLHVKFWIIIN